MSSSSSHATVFTGVQHPNWSVSQASHDLPIVITTRDRLRKDSLTERSVMIYFPRFFLRMLSKAATSKGTPQGCS